MLIAQLVEHHTFNVGVEGPSPSGHTNINNIMIPEKLENLSCKSKEYYKSITSIDVTPVEIRDLSSYLIHKKGDKIIKKRLFRKPKVITVTEDLYKVNDSPPYTAKELVRYYFYAIRYNAKKDIFYVPGEVEISFSSKKESECHKFDTDEKLKTFVSDLIDKCKKSGNDLL